MNAIAAQSAVARAPEIIVVNDGKPVESVEAKSKGARMAKTLALLLVPLLVGVAVGQIGTNAKIYNRTIEDAGGIAAEVKVVTKDLQQLRDILYEHKTHGPQGNSFKIGDEALSTALEGFQMKAANLEKVFESYLYEMDQAVIDQTLTFFIEAAQLQKEFKRHVELSRDELKAIVTADEKVRDKRLTPTRFAVYVQIPSADEQAKGAPVTAQLVEVGDPICQDGKPNPNGCQSTPRGFLYRPDEMGPWGTMELATATGDAIPGRKLLPLGPTNVLGALLRGGEATVSEYNYEIRIRDLEAKVDNLLERGKALEKQLTSTANKSKKFTFFL